MLFFTLMKTDPTWEVILKPLRFASETEVLVKAHDFTGGFHLRQALYLHRTAGLILDCK